MIIHLLSIMLSVRPTCVPLYMYSLNFAIIQLHSKKWKIKDFITNHDHWFDGAFNVDLNIFYCQIYTIGLNTSFKNLSEVEKVAKCTPYLQCFQVLGHLFHIFKLSNAKYMQVVPHLITYCCVEYTSPWTGFELINLVVIEPLTLI
jgi:hypothetical protein